MSDALIHGRRVRILNVADGRSREDLDGPIDTSLPATRVVESLERGGHPEWRTFRCNRH